MGQNFARASDIKFLDDQGKEELAWTTSWGVSTRLIGGLVMTHGDDDGLVLPPRLAPAHVAILPVVHKEQTRAQVMECCEKLAAELRGQTYHAGPLRVELDRRELRGGEKVWSWVKKGVPIRLEIGPRDIAQHAVCVGRRDRPPKQCVSMPRREFVETLPRQLDEIQETLLDRARTFREENTVRIDTKKEFYDFFTPRNREKPEIHGGFVWAHWCGEAEVEDQLKQDLQVTIRCIPLDGKAEEGKCPFTGKPSPRRVVFAKAY